MRALALPVAGDPGPVWRVGYAPDPWAWTPWEYASDSGRFNGRWDDEDAKFRTLYTSSSLLGCFLELLAPLRPHEAAWDELALITDDASQSAMTPPEPERGAVGMSWLSGRLFGRGHQTGTYAEVTTADALSHLIRAGVFDRLGVAGDEVDVALLKDARRRTITRSIARYLYDLHAEDRRPLVDGVTFRSRMGDDILLWAVFERADQPVSERITPESVFHRVTEDTNELSEAMSMLRLHWHRD